MVILVFFFFFLSSARPFCVKLHMLEREVLMACVRKFPWTLRIQGLSPKNVILLVF